MSCNICTSDAGSCSALVMMAIWLGKDEADGVCIACASPIWAMPWLIWLSKASR